MLGDPLSGAFVIGLLSQPAGLLLQDIWGCRKRRFVHSYVRIFVRLHARLFVQLERSEASPNFVTAGRFSPVEAR